VEAAEFLHVAALATVTALALEEVREQEATRLAAGLIAELRQGDVGGKEVVQRAARLGCDLVRGAVVIALEVRSNRPREAMALIASEYPGSIAELVNARVYAVLPARGGDEAPELTVNTAVELAGRLRGYGQSAVSSFYANPADLRRAIQEAELVLDVVLRDERMAEQLTAGIGSGVYRLLFRALVSHPEEVRSFYEDTVAPIVRYDHQYRTDLLSTLEAYLTNDCNMNATARAIYAHRHTVSYRLQRVKDLTGLDPMLNAARERLGLGLKAYRIVAPTLPR
jgi:sugar diacid utilization regulator